MSGGRLRGAGALLTIVAIGSVAGCGDLRDAAQPGTLDGGSDGRLDTALDGSPPLGGDADAPVASGDGPSGSAPDGPGPDSGDGPAGSEAAPALRPPGLVRCQELQHAGPGPACEPMGEADVAIWSVAFSADGQLAATAGSNGRVRLWKLTAGAFEPEGTEIATMLSARVAFSPDGKLLAAGGNAGELFLYDLAAKSKAPLPGHTERLRGVAFTADGARLVTVDRAGVLRTWDVAGRSPLVVQPLFQGVAEPWVLAVSGKSPQTTAGREPWVAVGLARATGMGPAGSATIPADGAYVWFGNPAAVQDSTLIRVDQTEVGGVAISPDDRYLLAGGTGSEIGVWDVSNRAAPMRVKSIPVVKDPRNDNIFPVTSLAFSAGGRYAAATYGGWRLGGAVRIIDTASFTVLNERFGMLEYYPVSAALTPAADALLVGEIGCGVIALCRD